MLSSTSTTPPTRVSTPWDGCEEERLSLAESMGDSDEAISDEDENANDIAIIGMGCRVPGGNNSPSELWDYLIRRGDASGDMPSMRWQAYHSRHPRNAETLARTTSKGYYLDRIEDFDASFFSVSPREAEQMDPQQRIALEVAWEALEDAGAPPQSLSGTNTAVYMGVNSDDYGKLILEDLQNVGAHMGVGTAYCGIPSRISYLLNLMGPSIAIDAACASSLVAVHQARQALLMGETDLAIAGGVNALIGPGLTRVLDEAGAIASDGKCRSFDDSAHGYGRGEGAGVVIMKRVAQALKDGDHVIGILKGSAVCADGKTVGIMAPNPVAQQLVAQKALSEAKVPAESISYIEAHATSTPLGDPTETEALAKVYGYDVRQTGSNPCLIGSVKSNIGHLEAGAGVLGLIKALLVLQKGIVPPQVNLENLNRKINWNENRIQACKETTRLFPSKTPVRAAIASYGYSGTVSHAIIEAGPPISPVVVPECNEPVILLLSAPQANRIPGAAHALAQWLENDGANAPLREIGTTLASRRGHHRYRSCVIAATKAEAIASLHNLSGDSTDPFVIKNRVNLEASKGAVWVFSGYGSHWLNMGQELYASRASFAEVVHQVEPIIQRELGFSATEVLTSGNIEGSDVMQAMTFLMHMGVAAVMLESSGNPSAVIGHSLGETAASVVTGALTLSEGALIVCRRARLFREVMGQGAMILATLTVDEARKRLGDRKNVSIAIDASPSSCVVSGSKDSIAKLTLAWERENVQVRKVNSDVPFHSHMLQRLTKHLYNALENEISPQPPRIKLYSTSCKDPRTDSLRDAHYWVNNMTQPVLLRSTVTSAAKDGYRAFVEVSSHPIVTHSIDETLQEGGIEDFIAIPTMLRNKPAVKNILAAIGKLHCFGCSIAYTKNTGQSWLSGLPRTVWSHQPYWRTVADVPIGKTVSHDPLENNLLGARTNIWGSDQVLFETQLDEDRKPFPGKHPLHGSEIVPAAVLINTFLKAIPTNNLENMSLKVPVVVSPPQDVQVLLEPHQISIASRLALNEADCSNSSSWLVNTTSKVGSGEMPLSLGSLDLKKIRTELSRQLASNFSTDYLAKVGVPDMGFPWKVIEHIENDNEMLAKVNSNPDGAPAMKDLLASMLDSATSIASTIFYSEPKLRMPTAVSRVIIDRGVSIPEVGYIYCRRIEAAYAADVLVCSEDGTVLLEIQRMEFAGIEGEESSRKTTNGLLHYLAWTPAAFAEEPLRFSRVALLTLEDNSIVPHYEKQLRAKGYITYTVNSVKEIPDLGSDCIVMHIPKRANSIDEVFKAASASCDSLVTAAKAIISSNNMSKLFCVISQESGPSALGYAPLHGLARIIQSEHPEIWGGLFQEEEEGRFPISAIKYIQGEDVVKIDDGIPRTARLRPLNLQTTGSRLNQARFRAGGTYLITGGLGALGLEIAAWMVERGARRILLASRRQFPHRSTWHIHEEDLAVKKVAAMEDTGATVHAISVDMSADNADVVLGDAIDRLNIPPVTGVVHAAGVLEDQLVCEITSEAFDKVLAPKMTGALHLDRMFPPGSLDFFNMFSSCGQLLGFPGQASYASSNAFLDALARQRRQLGDNAISMMWTSWRGLGMAASTEYINAELNARGITDITKEEAFMAWDEISLHDTDHAVILRALPLDADELLPHPILRDIVSRRPRVESNTTASDGNLGGNPRPMEGPELESYITEIVISCVASTLSIAESEIDPTVALSEMGMDSVMTVNFRASLQQKLRIKIAPTLIWKCPTIRLLVKHSMQELEG